MPGASASNNSNTECSNKSLKSYGALSTAEQGVAPEAVAEAYHAYEQGSKVVPLTAASISNQSIQESQRLLLLVRAYQVRFMNPQSTTFSMCAGVCGGNHSYWR